MTYTVTFNRIGREHLVAPLTADADNADQLAEQIHRYARPYLRSRDVEVVVDLAAGDGQIFAGFHSGGEFTIKES